MPNASPLRAEGHVRAFIATAGLAFGIVCFFATVNGIAGALSPLRAIVALTITFAGFLALGMARTVERPHGPVRLTLGIVIALSLLTILSMPIPPRPETISSDVILGAIIICALSAHLLLVPRPRIALMLLAVLALAGLFCDYAVARWLGWPGVTPAIKTAAANMAIIGSACIAALMLTLRRRRLSSGHAEAMSS